MHVVLTQTAVLVTRGDSKSFGSETAFWHALKKHLNARGHDLVKKIMSKDGHMVGGDEYPYYLRDRHWNYCIHDGSYMLRQLHKAFNAREQVKLDLVRWTGDHRLAA